MFGKSLWIRLSSSDRNEPDVDDASVSGSCNEVERLL